MAARTPSAGGPTRRSVLITALVTFAGVATARVLGVRDLSTGFTLRPRSAPAMDPMDDAMDMAMDMPESEVIPAEMAPEPMATASAPPLQAAATASPAPVRATTPTRTPAPTARPTSTPAAVAAMPPIAPPRVSGFDWASPLESEKARVAHLLRRATFGATDAELDAAQADGYARTVERLVETPPAEPQAPAAIAADANARIGIGDLQAWWTDWMLRSPTPFAEKMTLFWHGHFVSDYRKSQTNPMYWQNRTWRQFSLGKLADMLHRVTIDQAMLRYLDLATSTGRNPNENYARELMEIFTMGAGTFSEDDVKAGAKALAGWRLPRATESVRTGVFDPSRAYAGTLTFLGKTGTFDTTSVIDRVLAQDVTAAYIARQVAEHFISPFVADAYVARIAARFRSSGYQTRTLMREVFLSPEFTSPDAYRALVKGPTEFMVSAAKAIGSASLGRAIAAAGTGLGQNLFDPPSVGGWGDNAAWVSASTMLARANFVSTALGATRTLPPSTSAVARHLDGVLGPETARELATTSDDRRRWLVILSSPEFQLK